MAITPLTNQITAYKEVEDFYPDVAVDWAIEMIELGLEGEYLTILAGLSKPTNYYEVERYLLNALSDLGLSPQVGRVGVLSYSAYLIHEVAEGTSVKENLLAIHKISQTQRNNRRYTILPCCGGLGTILNTSRTLSRISGMVPPAIMFNS